MWHSGAFFGSKTGLWGLLNGSLGLSVTVGTNQAVEKVVLRVVGGPKQESNTYKPRPKHHKSWVLCPSAGLRKWHEGVFQHAEEFCELRLCPNMRTTLNTSSTQLVNTGRRRTVGSTVMHLRVSPAARFVRDIRKAAAVSRGSTTIHP